MITSADRRQADGPPKRLIAINRFYRPDHSATSQLLTELLEHLAGTGWTPTVIASRSSYLGDKTYARSEVLSGVQVRRIWSSDFGRAHLLLRSLDYLTFYASAFFALLQTVRRGDVVLAKTDPPMLSIIVIAVTKMKGARLVNWCQDLFPETAASLGMTWAKGSIGKVLRALRNASLRGASKNVVLHQKMADHLSDQGVGEDTLQVIPNWPDRRIKPVKPAENGTRSSWGYSAEVVIGYSGNLGRAHMPQPIANLVQSTLSIPNLRWLFIGAGSGLQALKEQIGPSEKVQFQPYQPIEKLSESLSVADFHLVTLDPECEGLIVPSKFYGILAANRPVLFLGAPDGAIASDIAKLERGLVLDLEQPERWREKVEALISDASPPRAQDETSTAQYLADNSLRLWRETLERAKLK